ncbi:MAG: stage V sporulation protein AD [Lachnospiraceae bacterium]
MKQMIGRQSIKFERPPYILSSASIVGKKEGEGPLGKLFDMIGADDCFGADTWENSESTLQKETATLAITKAGIYKESVRYVFAGDLLGQSIATTFGLAQLEIPLFGLYGACSTAGESISLAAMSVAAGYADYALAVTSSHFASAEKQFRYPLQYAGQRPLSATWTVTGSGAFVLSRKKTRIKIIGITTGKVVDYGVKDSMNMGAAMAPAAAKVIEQNIHDFGYVVNDYDKIITGDLGYVGKEILLTLLMEKGLDITGVHMDCGIEIFDQKKQDTHSGGSGCGCAAATLSALILKKIEEGEWHRVLFVPTGALLSTVSFNQGMTVPGIAHGVVFQQEDE